MEIHDSDAVLRRILPDQFEQGEITSKAFTPDEISAHLERLVNLAEIKRSFPNMLMARLSVKGIRADGFDDVIHDPTPEDPSHTVIVRKKTNGYGKKTRKRRLKTLADIVKF